MGVMSELNVGQMFVDMVNPRLSQYGKIPAGWLAIGIALIQICMIAGVMCYSRSIISSSSKLMDYTDVLHVIDHKDDTKAGCGTFDDNLQVAKGGLSLSFGRLDAGKCKMEHATE